MSNTPFIGEIRIFAGNFAPQDWAICDGGMLPISENEQLFSLIGVTFGGDGVQTFALPDLRGRVAVHPNAQFPVGQSGGQEAVQLMPQQIPAHSHAASATSAVASQTSPAGALWASGSHSYSPAHPDGVMSPNNTIMSTGDGQPHENMLPYLTINFIIALTGIVPASSGADAGNALFTAEVRLVAFNFAPAGWALANGQLLPIAKNQALFSLLGTTYGGDGKTTFALPNLQGRTAIHRDSNQYGIGTAGGEQAHTLTIPELPSHTHTVNGNGKQPNPGPSVFPAGAVWGVGANSHYSEGNPTTTMNNDAISSVGGGQPHQNMSPFLVVSYIIRTGSSYPTQ